MKDDRVSRFQREAKLLASLNHPSITAIYGLEAFDNTNFLILELVEGKTLAEPLKRGPIPRLFLINSRAFSAVFTPWKMPTG
jgi:serine/threonine protein kinase